MSDIKKDDGDWISGIGVIVGIVCAIAGYSQGGWPLAIIAFFLAFGAVHLAVRLLGYFIGWAISGVILFIGFLILKNRVEWIGNLFN